uniref:Organic solute carrier partner 1a n=1 Tax=Neogobius melanostomus TaxID=47308 RepID=A0A8C6TNP7_9GOBI
MSTRTLPLRLREGITPEDGLWTERDRRRVLSDVVGTMFSKTFMDELFKPQTLYSHRTMKTVMSRLAHASIMRLNPASMDRLFELMLMAFKYQVFLCPRPKDLLLISHNHLDSIRDLVQDRPAVQNQVHETQRRLIETYTCLPPGELQLLRQTLLIFFQDYHIRMSVFMQSRVQNMNGRFVLGTTGPVPHGAEVPGLIRTLDCRGREVQRCQFPTGGAYTSAVREGSFDISGDRVLKLGTNIESQSREDTTPDTPNSISRRQCLAHLLLNYIPVTVWRQTECGPNPLAKEELNLLSRLMGTLQSESEPRPGPEKGFRINLFPSDREEDEADAEESWSGVINIQAMKVTPIRAEARVKARHCRWTGKRLIQLNCDIS